MWQLVVSMNGGRERKWFTNLRTNNDPIWRRLHFASMPDSLLVLLAEEASWKGLQPQPAWDPALAAMVHCVWVHKL